MSWQYNGVAPFDEIYQWCRQHIPDQFTINGWETFIFKSEKSYLWFVMRWL